MCHFLAPPSDPPFINLLKSNAIKDHHHIQIDLERPENGRTGSGNAFGYNSLKPMLINWNRRAKREWYIKLTINNNYHYGHSKSCCCCCCSDDAQKNPLYPRFPLHLWSRTVDTIFLELVELHRIVLNLVDLFHSDNDTGSVHIRVHSGHTLSHWLWWCRPAQGSSSP